ncbi:MAG: hypothetical protein QM775_34100 [Pirellulales bacterium]
MSSQNRDGWIGLECDSAATASWLVRAVVAENVIARYEDATLFVPAGPTFRVEKEIKNVVVCVAKSCHYLFDHLEPEDQPSGDARSLIGPPLPQEIVASSSRYEQIAESLEERIRRSTGLTTRRGSAIGWVGADCESEEAAVWLLRAVATEDVLVRREDATLYVPVDIDSDSDSAIEKTARAVSTAYRLWRYRAAKR